MLRWFASLWGWVFGAPDSVAAPLESMQRLHITRATYQELHARVQPRIERGEPLALLLVRFAAESRQVLVAVGVIPMPETAYVSGPDGANFDTRAVVELANRHLASNTGILLVHSHGGVGRPDFGDIDRRTNTEIMAKLAIGIDTAPYGAMVLSRDSATIVAVRDGALVEADLVVVPSFGSSGILA